MSKGKIKSIVVLVVAMIISCSVFADGWGEFRKNESENCPSGRKWIAHAEVKCNFLQGWVKGSAEVCEPYCATVDKAIGNGANRRAYQKPSMGKSVVLLVQDLLPRKGVIGVAAVLI
jgi:hypothetical protein